MLVLPLRKLKAGFGSGKVSFSPQSFITDRSNVVLFIKCFVNKLTHVYLLTIMQLKIVS